MTQSPLPAYNNQLESIFDDPLVISKIASFLPVYDAVNLHWISNAHDAIGFELLRKRTAKEMQFATTLQASLELIRLNPVSSKAQLNRFYNSMLENKQLLLWHPVYNGFRNSVESSLVQLLGNQFYTHQALWYLAELFHVHLKIVVNENGEETEYIVDSQGYATMIPE